MGLCRCESKERFNEIRGNLVYGSKPRGFWILDQVYLPEVGVRERDSWDEEVDFLMFLLEQETTTVPVFVQHRLTELENAMDNRVRGLSDNLFLKSCTEQNLVLRSGFAFLDFHFDTRKINQAETYFVVTCVLHHMRCRGDSARLGQDGMLRTVLSPRCFDRFNDGAIQASILRAAKRIELDYSHSEKISGEMRTIIEVIFRNSSNEIGEAAREFALALAIGRLTLAPPDLDSLRENANALTTDAFVRICLELSGSKK